VAHLIVNGADPRRIRLADVLLHNRRAAPRWGRAAPSAIANSRSQAGRVRAACGPARFPAVGAALLCANMPPDRLDARHDP